MKILIFLGLFACSLLSVQAQEKGISLEARITELSKSSGDIATERKKELNFLAKEIKALLQEKGRAPITFVCTHNSRRSQLAQIWMNVGAAYYNIKGIESYSGGTEATAFNIRMVKAVKAFGFNLQVQVQKDNPEYLFQYPGANDLKLFSKKYDDAFNPKQDFIAVMVCSQADKACPFVPGAYSRVSIPYLDPKAADNTPDESASYDAKVEEIGKEVLYLCALLK